MGCVYAEPERLTAGCCSSRRWWVGFQSCVMPCEDTARDDVAGECGRNLVVSNNAGVCASPANAEQFYNCADVIIRPSGGECHSSLSHRARVERRAWTTQTHPPRRAPPCAMRTCAGTVRPSPPPPSPVARQSPPPPSPAAKQSPPPPSPATARPPSPSASCPIADQAAYCRALGAGLFPDPCSCNQFFNCGAGGAGGRQSCPSGLLFNKTTKQCDWPANVAC